MTPIKALTFKLGLNHQDVRALIKEHLEGTDLAVKVKNKWMVTDDGVDKLRSLMHPTDDPEPIKDAFELPPSPEVPDHHDKAFEVPVLSLPINNRLVIVEVDGKPCRATVKPMLRKTIRPKNLVFVEYMGEDIYRVVRRGNE